MPPLKTSDPKAGRHYRKHLSDFTVAVSWALELLDREMKLPSSHERGRRIAAITNALELARDQASHFGLGNSLGRRFK